MNIMSSTSIIWLVDYYRFLRAENNESFLLAQHFLLNYDGKELEFSVTLVPKPRHTQFMDLRITLVKGTISRPITLKLSFYVQKRSCCSHTVQTMVPGNNHIVWLDAIKRPKTEPSNVLKFGLDVMFGNFNSNMQIVNVDQMIKALASFGSLLNTTTDTHHDIVFEVGDEEIKAHKSILSVRNHVFAAMFAHNYQENISNRVKIEDIPANIFKMLLHYLYTAVMPAPKELNIDILKAAHKYGILELEQMCLKSIDATLSNDNAIEVLVLYDMYGFEQNKEQVIKFINKNCENIMTEKLWLEFAKEHPKLLIDLYKKAKFNGKRRSDEGYQSSSSSSSGELFVKSKRRR